MSPGARSTASATPPTGSPPWSSSAPAPGCRPSTSTGPSPPDASADRAAVHRDGAEVVARVVAEGAHLLPPCRSEVVRRGDGVDGRGGDLLDLAGLCEDGGAGEVREHGPDPAHRA